MKKIIVLSLGIFFISGCLIRTYTVYKPRINTKVSGNRGYIMGEPEKGKEVNKEKKPSLGEMRPVTVFEIELGAHVPEHVTGVVRKAPSKLKEKKASESKESSGGAIEEEINKGEGATEEVISVKSITENTQAEYKYYTVQENDTLQKISSKFYGTTRKWKIIYENNKSVIKNSNRVYPGTKIKIPFYKQ